jgi:four helix bundle protein
MKEEMTIFTRTHDFISWLIPRTMDFPRSQRFVTTKRLQDAALDFYEDIIEANTSRGGVRLSLLRKADASLNKVRHYLRLCTKWNWFSHGQYEHASRFITEMGRLLGGWIKTTAP